MSSIFPILSKEGARMANKVYEIITDQIIEIMEKGVIPWKKLWDYEHGQNANLISKRPYSGVNVLMTAVTVLKRGFTSPYWLTFKQAKKLNGEIIKGEKSTTVVFCKNCEFIDKDKESEEETIKRFSYLRFYRVWNVQQVKGVEIPPIPEKPFHGNKSIDRCATIIQSMPNRPRISQNTLGTASYIPSKDTVSMPGFQRFHNSEGYYKTLYHELIHSTGHKSRLNRDLSNYFGTLNYGKEELIAELGTALLSPRMWG